MDRAYFYFGESYTCNLVTYITYLQPLDPHVAAEPELDGITSSHYLLDVHIQTLTQWFSNYSPGRRRLAA